MPSPERDREEVARRAHEIYERDIRALVEPEQVGKFVVLDVETGDYEVDDDELAASRRVEARNPGGGRRRFLLRIGYPAAYQIGGSSLHLLR